MSCGVSSCKNKAKLYGVCGRHKSYAFECSDIDFQTDLARYRKIYEEFQKEDYVLISQGHNILDIQTIWGNNIYGMKSGDYPSHLAKAGRLYDELRKIGIDMSSKYNGNLVSNAMTRITHSISDSNCNCMICGLVTH